MRFRAKFGLLGWAYVGSALLVLVLRLGRGHHNDVLATLAVFLPVFAAFKILAQIVVYWDLDSVGLHERRLWGERQIPWQEVTRVSAWNPERPSSDFLAVHYARSAPMSDRGSVIANPDDRDQFLADLRRYAPLAVFDV
jgi:hypothetical protein